MSINELNEMIAEVYKSPKRRLRRMMIWGTAGALIGAFALTIPKNV